MREILSDIVADDKRAADVIRACAPCSRRASPSTSLSTSTASSMRSPSSVRNDVVLRNVPMSLDPAADLPGVRGDRVQRQQVVLNMVLDGLDAMREANGRDCALVIGTARASPRPSRSR
jgi:two-component system sensor kinase FixL